MSKLFKQINTKAILIPSQVELPPLLLQPFLEPLATSSSFAIKLNNHYLNRQKNVN